MGKISVRSVRGILEFTLWWLIFFPAMPVCLNSLFLSASAAALICGGSSLLMNPGRSRNIMNGIYTVCLLIMVWLSATCWIFPAAVMGILTCGSLFVIFLLSPHDSPQSREKSAFSESNSPLLPCLNKPLPFLRFALHALIWFAGMIVISVTQSPWQPVLLVLWTSIMLLLGNHVIWPFAAYPEWLGYKARRKIFISKKRWILRFALALFLFLSAMILWIFYQ